MGVPENASSRSGDKPQAELPEHIEQTVRTIAEVHEAHNNTARPMERAAAGLIAAIGRPTTLLLLIAASALWIGGNLAAFNLGYAPLDRPPFAILELAWTISALLLAVLILTSQRRDDRLAEQRASLTLQLALLSEQKTAKIIALLEELRRDLPSVPNRRDRESEAMGEAADAQSVLDAIEAKAIGKDQMT